MTHSPATREKIAVSRRRQAAMSRARPGHCVTCGKSTRWSALYHTRRGWECGDCVLADMEPLRIEDFATQTGNLGKAEEEG